ncbi:MAG TPA: single-stranded-DNA-specific exonuclease RecJ [Blastocatellia bacterium]|jgi:single-stranded-DNA-specific exonuclease|nr:single-stranded-DNA-specific exonuclease RecJ [Blastocatellia bacterium]
MTPSLTKLTRGLTGARWHAPGYDPKAPALLDSLQSETGENRILLRCLLNRGITTAEEIRKFLAPEFFDDLHSPFLLRDMEQAAERLRRAIRDRERIRIVTDFDVDGTTSSVILSNTLKLLGAGDLISCYIPDRFTEGYGLSSEIVERAASEGFQIIVTADIGIKSHAEARLARQLGIDLIICDHHLPDGEDVPAEAFAVLCPKGSSGEGYPNKHLAACGVSLKLADALLTGREKRDAILSSLAKLAAIGTIADLVDLSASENRAIVAHGLRALNQRSNNPGLRSLLKLSQVNSPITAYDVGFKIGPRINAAGRVAHADSVLSLFDAKTDDEAMKIAFKLDAMNAQRQHLQSVLLDKLKALIEAHRAESDPDRILVFAGAESEGFHRGVIGIVCSKIVEMTGRPTFICSIDEEGIAHGSARSINGFHLVEALDSVSDALVKYGGHPMAAGFAVPAGKIEEMRYRLNRHAAEILNDDDLGRALNAEAEITLEDATLEAARALARLEPHGMGNPQPLFLMRHAPLRSVQRLKEKHLKFLIGRERTEIEALWWNAAEHLPEFAGASRISFMCRLEINKWVGRENCQLKVIDAAIDKLISDQ